MVGEVRGTGVFWAIEFVRDRETREPLAPYGGSSPEIAALLAACSGAACPFSNFNRTHFVSPLTVTADEVDAAWILDEALTEASTAC